MKKLKREISWKKIKDNFSKLYDGEDPVVLEYVANDVLLRACCEGLSNAVIAEQNELSIEEVRKLFIDFLGFPGWKHTLDISPFFRYNICDDDYTKFRSEVKVITQLLDDNDIKDAFKICEKYKKIRKEIDEYYDRH